MKNFVTSFRSTHKQNPNLFSSQVYNAIAADGFTREGTRKALLSMKPHKGVSDSISFPPETCEAVAKTFLPLVMHDEKIELWQDCADNLAKQ